MTFIRAHGRAVAVMATVTLTLSAQPGQCQTRGAADFVEYKTKLLSLVATFHRGRTTTADMEAIFGQTFTTQHDDYSQEGWIKKAAGGYKSLVFRSVIDLFFGQAQAPQGQAKPVYFETQYTAFFYQTYQNGLMEETTPDPATTDPATCLTLTELKAALKTRHLALGAPEVPPYGIDFLVTTSSLTRPEADKDMTVSAGFRPFHPAEDSGKMDVSDGCLMNIGIN